MRMLLQLRRTLIFAPLWLVVGGANAQAVSNPTNEELFRTISSLDAEVFDAYNRCDLKKFGSYFPSNLEFYHDNGGLVSKTRKSLVESVKTNICGKVRRELVPGTLQIYPLRGYGAVETGVHRFYHPGHDDTEPVGEGKFVHLWQQTDNGWKITRVISYDHHALPK